MTSSASPDSYGLRPLGKRLRALRKARGLKLRDVAEAAALSIGFISQVERDLAVPSLASLAAIARALGLPVAALLPGIAPPRETTVSAERPLYRTVPQAAVHYERLSTSFPGSMLNGVIIHEAPGHKGHPSSHDGEELFFVLSGAITVEVDGERTVLNAGDSLHFSSRRTHASWNHTDAPASILHVCTMDVFGDRIAAEARSALHENHRTAGPDGGK